MGANHSNTHIAPCAVQVRTLALRVFIEPVAIATENGK